MWDRSLPNWITAIAIQIDETPFRDDEEEPGLPCWHVIIGRLQHGKGLPLERWGHGVFNACAVISADLLGGIGQGEITTTPGKAELHLYRALTQEEIVQATAALCKAVLAPKPSLDALRRGGTACISS